MKKILTIALAIIVISACNKSANEINPVSKTTSAEKQAQTRPFEVNLYSTADANSPLTPCSGDLPGFAIGGLNLYGTATHMGLIDPAQSTLQHTSCDLSFATALLTNTVEGHIAAANGDLIFYTGNDTINVFNLLTGADSLGTIRGVWTITGGEGRFAGATGSLTVNGPVNFNTSTFSGIGVGTISY